MVAVKHIAKGTMPTHYTYTYWSKALSYVRVTCGVIKLLAYLQKERENID